MINRITAYIEYVVALFLDWYWHRVERHADKEIKKQMDLNISPVTVHIPVLGAVPLDTFANIAKSIVPNVIDGLKKGHDAEQIMKTLKANAEPALLATAEAILGVAFPAAGTLLGLLVWMVQNSKPMTQEEENKWMDRFGLNSSSGT